MFMQTMNERWKSQGKWHYEEAREELHPFGFWVLRRENEWRFWCLTPSAAYWLAAQLNEPEEPSPHPMRRERQPIVHRDDERYRPMRMYS